MIINKLNSFFRIELKVVKGINSKQLKIQVIPHQLQTKFRPTLQSRQNGSN